MIYSEITEKMQAIREHAKQLAEQLRIQRGKQRGGYIVISHESGLHVVSAINMVKKCNSGTRLASWAYALEHVLNYHSLCHDYRDVSVKWVKTIAECGLPPEMTETAYCAKYSPEVRELTKKMGCK